MSKAKESLVALLVSSGLAAQDNAEAFVESMDDLNAKRIVDAIMESTGGKSNNLPSGAGGVIGGLADLVNARKIDAKFSLPENPYELPRADKTKAIEQFDEANEASDKLFVDGLRNLLAAKNQERLDTLQVWKRELSDQDFPFAMQKVGEFSNDETEKLINEVKKKLEIDRENLLELAKKHRDTADDEE
jgi:hypothetical protein